MVNIEKDNQLEETLKRYSPEERLSWLAEINRLVLILQEYSTLQKKRRLNKKNGKYEFLPEVLNICQRAACRDHLIIAREPHRARPPAPTTIDRWHGNFKENGVLAFLRGTLPEINHQTDRRKTLISPLAVSWLNNNFRKYRSPRALYKALKKEANQHSWVVPSESWLVRHWRQIPQIVKIPLLEGESAYESKLAPYVPRNHEDLDALQVLSGDHMERDVTVHIGGGKLARPWVTLWLDLKCYLIWGWYLDLIPNSESVALAYADGLNRFGAQPFSRPDENYYSYIQTDLGKTYCSHDINGKIIKTYHKAFVPTAGFQTLLTEKKVGLVNDFNLVHLKARWRNAKEKPVERIGKDISEWEANTFAGYCGRNANERPDKWYELYEQHQKFIRGEIKESPFISLEEYRKELSHFFEAFNAGSHERTTLGGKTIVPLEEFNRIYTTKYKIPESETALLLLKSCTRTIRKNGVNCFRRDWNYMHPALSMYKNTGKFEVRYTDRDYSHVYVILPDREVCRAELITPTSIINPNKEVLKKVAKFRAHEKEIKTQYQLINTSEQRGETVEDRFSAQEVFGNEKAIKADKMPEAKASKATVIKFPQHRNKHLAVVKTEKKQISIKEVQECNEAEVKTLATIKKSIREFAS